MVIVRMGDELASCPATRPTLQKGGCYYFAVVLNYVISLVQTLYVSPVCAGDK